MPLQTAVGSWPILSVSAPIDALLSEAYAAERRKLFNPAKAQVDTKRGSPVTGTDTVSFQVVDGYGMAVSMVNSNYMGFGSGLVPSGCGFSLQNRGANFAGEPGHPNAYDGGKRPYHTIIPGMITDDQDRLFASFTNMGGFMQPQGHLQLLLNIVVFGMDPQSAIDAPRICITLAGNRDGTTQSRVCLEDGIRPEVVEGLRKLGHNVEFVQGYERAIFGRAQIIRRMPESGVLWGGSDGRADGMAVGF